MVYCGKPSRGCQMCRTRRIKCDETKPTCNQCAKSRRQCPGYKDEFDLIFRNETQSTERKARKANNGKKASNKITFMNHKSTFSTIPQDDNSGDSQALVLDRSDTSIRSPEMMISIPYEQQAPCFFVTNYVLQPQYASRGYFDFLEPMLEKESPDSRLSLAFAAVSMASLANRPNSRGRLLHLQALKVYAEALKAVNIALQTPALQKSDSTLAAVLMLGFFETISTNRTNPSSWYPHINGAVQLVKMRGRKSLRTKIGNSLFLCVRSQMIGVCLSSNKLPPLGVDWWLGEQKNDAGSFVTKLNLRIAELRYELNTALSTFPRTPEYFQEIYSLMKRAQAMEQEYLEWEARVPREWQPCTVAWVDQPLGSDITQSEVCPGKVDMYPDLWTAQLWNSARTARMFISGVIVRCAAWICSPADYRTTPEYAQAVTLCGGLVSDIVASVPYYLGWNVNQGGMFGSGDSSGFNSWGKTGPLKAIGGFFIMWALFSVTNTDYVSNSHRSWAKSRLMYISDVLGLNHARVLSTFELRLPSMGIRRDNLISAPPTRVMAGIPTRGLPSAVAGNISQKASTVTCNQVEAQQIPFADQNQNLISSHPSSSSLSLTSKPTLAPVCTMNPLEQREAMQRVKWETERENLVKKASNKQGDSVERMMAVYLQV